MFNIDTSAAGAPPPVVPQNVDGSGFAKHGIGHLSASSLNLWTNAPDVWVAKYLLGHKQTFGPAPRRGQCVEDAVVEILQGKPQDQAFKRAYGKFDTTRFGATPTKDIEKERAMIEPMTDLAVEALREYGAPEFQGKGQDKVTLLAEFDGWSIPVIGFLDLVFPDHGLVVDLKTTGRMPSTMSAEHQLQRAIYDACTGNSAVKFLYVTPKKSGFLEDGETSAILARAKVQIARLERFLATCEDAQHARAIIPTNPSSFYWKGDSAGLGAIYGL